MQRRALPDVNVLVALLDAAHVHHRRALNWWTDGGPHDWATCALTQNGCLRVLSHPAYPNPWPVAAVLERLRDATAMPSHRFIADSVSLLDASRFRAERLTGQRQVADAWLLGLCVEHGLQLVSFDAVGAAAAAVEGVDALHLLRL